MMSNDFLKISDCSTEGMLEELVKRGGHPGVLAEAALLAIKKGSDYNDVKCDVHEIDRTEYFPFGVASYATMINTKSLRFMNLAKKRMAGDSFNFEGLEDTALDLINYAGFYLCDKSNKKNEVIDL